VLLLVALVLCRRPFAIWTDAPELGRRRPFWKEWLRTKWLRWVFRRAFRVMGTGQLALRNLRAMGCSESRLVDLPYVIDALAFPHAIRSAPRGGAPIVFVSTGRLVTYKGYGLAIRALAAARQHGVSFRYVLAGIGPQEGEFRKLADELGIAEHVHFAGWLEPMEIQQFLLQGHFLLHPAIFEPFGVTVIEAMASGLPVIGSDGTGAVVDRVIDGQSGFVHRAGDVASLTEQILRAASGVAHLEEMSAAALASAQEWSPTRAAKLVRSLVEAWIRGAKEADG
jgi:glycosyltransferase involved in cell wall biosynthesis